MTQRDIRFCDLQVTLDHIEGGVSKNGLEGVGVPTGANIGDGKGMAEFVNIDIQDTGPFSDIEKNV